ncbi:hypothetical protein SAMN03159391_02502 [Pseudomonas sp. NFACC37-1]|nr:hypothetical protein SAMN03159391_02502 [Pseudomonas sp. NFACC37-1]
MARFFPTLDHAEFRSKGEFTLIQKLAALGDGFTIIHSLSLLRGRTERVYSQELQEYLQVSLDRKHLSGEVDFVTLHAELGMLCIETSRGNTSLRAFDSFTNVTDTKSPPKSGQG